MEWLALIFALTTTGPGLAGLIPLGVALVAGEDVAVAMFGVVAGAAMIEDWVHR